MSEKATNVQKKNWRTIAKDQLKLKHTQTSWKQDIKRLNGPKLYPFFLGGAAETSCNVELKSSVTLGVWFLFFPVAQTHKDGFINVETSFLFTQVCR